MSPKRIRLNRRRDDIPVCERCGQKHERANRPGIPTCTGHKARADVRVPCMSWPTNGLTVCPVHGGATRAARAKAAERVDRQQAEAEVGRIVEQARAAGVLGGPVDLDPRTHLMNLIRYSAGHVEWYRQQVEALAPGALIAGTRGVTVAVREGFEAGTARTTDVGPAVHLWLDRYDKERDRLAGYCATAIRLGIELRRVEMEQAVGAQIAGAFTHIHEQARAALGDGAGAEVQRILTETLTMLATGNPFPGVLAH